MNVDAHRRAKVVFDDVCELDASSRQQRLMELQLVDPELARLVSEWLDADQQASPLLQSRLLDADFTLSRALIESEEDEPEVARTDLPPAIGVFRIRELIGRGGMGEVYRAHQQHPSREVALKIARGRTLTPTLRRQFELEVDALARLSHPGIAQIHDAGTARFGGGDVPYLVMELVDGQDLAEYAAAEQLSPRARVELVASISRAISHAHKRDVVHRDLKPQNLLVDEAGQVKVVDFGLACFADEETSLRAGVGTLPYMSPEQGAGAPGGNGFQTDIYSIGAIAFELLAGQPPLDLSAFTDQRAALERVATAARPPLRDLAPDVDRDLAAVVDKALAPRALDRYGTVGAFLHDLELWLEHRPVTAREPGTLQRTKQFVRRNRVGVGAAVVLLGVVGSGLGGTISQAQAARAETRRVNSIRVYLSEVLRSTGEPRTDGVELPVSHALARAVERLDESFSHDARTRAELADTLGMAYFENGNLDEGERLVREAFDWRAAELGPIHVDTLASRSNLGIILVQARKNLEAEEILEGAVEGQTRALGPAHDATIRSKVWLGHLLRRRGRSEAAEALYEAAWKARTERLGASDPLTMSAMQSLAAVWREQSRLKESEEALRGVLARMESTSATDPMERARCKQELALVLCDAGQPAEAESLMVDALAEFERLRGPAHPETEIIEASLTSLRAGYGSVIDANSAEKDSPPAERPRRNSSLAQMMRINGAVQAFRSGDSEEAESLVTTAIEALQTSGGQEFMLRDAKVVHGMVLAESGRRDEAIALMRSLVQEMAAEGLGDSVKSLWYRCVLADFLRKNGELKEAHELIVPAWEALETLPRGAKLYAISSRSTYALTLADLDQPEAGMVHIDAAVEAAEIACPGTDIMIGLGLNRSRILTRLDRLDEAREQLETVHAIALERFGPDSIFVKKAERITQEIEQRARQ